MTTESLHHLPSLNVSALDADAMSRRGFSFRVIFAVLAALAASLVTPLAWLATWLVLIFIWEMWLAQFLTNAFVWPVYERSPRTANLRQTCVVALGAALFGAFPFLTWPSGTILGALLGLAWAGGTAIHVFVYLSNHRSQLIVGLAPPVGASLIMPFASLGLDLEALAGAAASIYLISAAAVFAFDRNVLLVEMATQKAATLAAEDAARAKTAFLNAVTHELRTPINQIVGYAGMLEEDIRDGAAEAADATNIAVAGATLLRLVNRVIDISRAETGALTLDPSETLVSTLLQRAADSVATAAERSGNKVVINCEIKGLVFIDDARVLDCLNCLSENAAQYCANGVITFAARRAGSDIELSVADTGPGISEAALRQMEASAITTSAEGLGLGLTYARALSRALGGSLSLSSTLGQGTMVTLKLPATWSQSQR